MKIRQAVSMLVAAPLCVACSLASIGRGAEANGDDAARGGSGTVIGRELLGHSGALLDVLVSRVGNVEVGSAPGCPRIIMRGTKSIAQPNDPRVYVNGSPAGDTCILQLIRTNDVQRVELYPMGVTARPGYRSNSGGLILVFMQDGHDAGEDDQES